MSQQIDALKLALEALKFALHVGFDESSESQIKKGDKAVQQHQNAITALQEALAAQQRHISYVCPQCYWSLEEQPAQQEPVALLTAIRAEPTEMIHKWRVIDIIQSSPPQGIYYTPPAQRKPLTDSEIIEMRKMLKPAAGQLFNSLQFARAIEAAHGIKGDA